MLIPGFQNWYGDINKTLLEAMKYVKARPKSPEVDHKYERQATGHEGMSAEEVGKSVHDAAMREYQLNKRLPRLEIAPESV